MQLKDKTAIVTGAASGIGKLSGAMDEGQGPLTHGTRRPEVPAFFNQMGVDSIEIGVTALDCLGALPPHDHPHVYLNMGEQADIQCPYCSTRYRFNPALRWNETIPPNCWVARG